MITLPPPTRLKLAVHSAFRKIQRALRRIDPFSGLRSIRFFVSLRRAPSNGS